MIGNTAKDGIDEQRRDESSLRRELEQAGAQFTGRACRCVFHDDSRDSAGVYSDDAGVWRYKCQVPTCAVGGDVFDIRAKLTGRSLADVLRDARREHGNGDTRRIVAEYDYTTGAGELLYQVVRFVPKDFRQRRPDGSGGWTWSTKGIQRVLYRLPTLADVPADSSIFIVEGERDSNRLAELGMIATTTSGGAGKAHMTDLTPLHGRHIVIIADRDDAGQKHAQQLADLLHGRAASVKVIELPGNGRKDASDWLDGGGDADELVRIAEAAPTWTPATEGEAVDGGVDADADRQFMLTDTGNAERLVAMFADRIRYVAAWGRWLVWSGVRWETDQTSQIDQFAKRTIRSIYRHAAEQDDANKRAQLADWARSSESASRRAAMVKLAQSEPGVAVAVEHLDGDGWLLNTMTGTVDLRTGEVRPHDPRDLITKLAPVALAAEVTCPVYTAFMRRIFTDNAALVEYVERLIGYAMTGDVRHHVLPIAWGDGANGKSTLFDLVLCIMGDYAAPAPDSLMMQRTGDEHPTELADCFGRRLLIATENDEGRKLRIGTVKKLTGDAKLKGRYMRRDYFTFDRTHKLLLVTNNRPRVTEDSTAIWRRLRLIPFTVTIPDAEQDRALPDKLRREAGAILGRWIAAGLRWQAAGYDLGEPAEVTDATEDYRDTEDVLAEFIASDCIVADHARVTRTDLWEAYSKWAERERIPHPMGTRTLYERIRRVQGVTEAHVQAGGRSNRGFEGIGLAFGGPTGG